MRRIEVIRFALPLDCPPGQRRAVEDRTYDRLAMQVLATIREGGAVYVRYRGLREVARDLWSVTYEHSMEIDLGG